MSTEAKKKNYVKGSAKEHVFENGGSILHVDLKVDDLKRLPINEAGYVKLNISKLPNPDNYGNTHSIYENDWKPAKDGKPAPKAKMPLAPFGKDDLPF